MRSWRTSEPVIWLLGAAGVALFAVVQTSIFYSASPVIGIALALAIGATIVVFVKPVLGVYAGSAAVALEILGTQISPLEGLLLLAAGALVARWAFAFEIPRIDPAFAIFGAALLWMVTGLAIGRDIAVIERTLLMWSAFAVVALSVSNSDEQRIRHILWAIVVGAVLTALIALANGTAQEARAGATAVEGRAQGSFTHPAQLAFFLVMTLPPALVLAVRNRGALRLAGAAAAIVILVVLVLTLTRGAIIGASVSLAVMLVWPPFRKIAAVALVGLLLVGVFKADAITRSDQLQLVGQRIATIADPDQANVNNMRLTIWATVPQIAADHPLFGVGVGNFSEYSLYYGLIEGGEGFEHAHNVGLTVLSEQGIPGFLLLLALLAVLGRHAATALRMRRHPEFPYALAVIAGLAGLCVNSLTDYPPGSNPNMALMLIEIGVLVSVVRRLRQPPA